MRRTVLATAVALIAIGSMTTASAQSLTVTVDCGRGQTIARALEQGDARNPLVVLVRGTCNEHVSIGRDNVTLRGVPGTGPTVNGPSSTTDTIVILKDMVNIEDLTVTGGFNGIRLQGPSYAGVRNVLVRNTANNGIIVRAGDIAIENSTVEYAGGSGLVLGRAASARIFRNSNFRYSHFAGIYAQNNSTVAMVGTETLSAGTVSHNEGNGITLESGSQGNVSYVEIFDNATGILVSASQANIIHGNFIHHNRAHGVNAQMGAVIAVDGSTITHNEQGGVFGYLGSTVVMHGNEITDNTDTGVACHLNCTLQIEGALITRNAGHGIVIQAGSTLTLYQPETNASGNYGWVDLWCGDKESSASGLAEYFVGSTFGCTDFNE